jgi:hypothetical protein
LSWVSGRGRRRRRAGRGGRGGVLTGNDPRFSEPSETRAENMEELKREGRKESKETKIRLRGRRSDK